MILAIRTVTALCLTFAAFLAGANRSRAFRGDMAGRP